MPGRTRQDADIASAVDGGQQRPGNQRPGNGNDPSGGGARDPLEIGPVQRPRRGGGKWRLRNWRLRWKLLVVLLVPLITAVALGALRVTGQLQNANIYSRISQQIAVSNALSDVIDSMQREREQIALFVASGGVAGNGPNGTATQQVDAAVDAFRRLSSTSTDLGAASRTQVNNAVNALGDLDALRVSASSSHFPEVNVLSGYNQIMDTLLDSAQLVGTGAADQRVYQLASAVAALREAKEQFTRGNAILMMTVTPIKGANGVVSPGWVFLPGTEDKLDAAQAEYQAALNTFNTAASAADQQMYLDTVAGPEVDARAQLLTLIKVRADSNAGPPPATGPNAANIQPTSVQDAGDGSAGLLHDVEQNLDTELKNLTDNLSSDARNQAIQDGLILAGALLVAFLVTLLVARSLLQSLRRLRAGALEVARSRLPQSVQRILADPDPIRAANEGVDPVPVFTADEIGEVARSFDVVHGQAIRLAAEQAVLRDNVNAIFINLSRRSQALVERQLALIDRLEKDEQDPDQLSNLFELDHLATRMRRNSESLLVLSGSGLAKRMSRPVPIGELVGAAVSEVEQYARIDVGTPPGASVLGRVVNDLIHLIAELLDNATSYSEPNTRVSVRIARTRSRELAIQITDRGVGMSDDDVRLANERLANPPDIDVGVTRRMGLYVVARLARRHGIRVKLRANEDIDGGTVALIVIPEDLVHRPGEESINPLAPEPMLAADPATTGESLASPIPSRRTELAGAASAAAGIAGAFGVTAARAGGREEQFGGPGQLGGSLSSSGVGNLEPLFEESEREPATAFWASDFEPSGQLDAAAEPVGSEPEEEREPASNAASLWEAHTAVDAGPAPDADAAVDDAEDGGWQAYTPAAPGAVNGGARPDVDAPTERLPIYEAVLSQWFRADEAQEAPPVPDEPEPVAPSTPSSPPSAPVVADGSAPLPTRVPGRAGAAAGFGMSNGLAGADTTPPVPATVGAPTPVGATNGTGNGTHSAVPSEPWSTPADEGWQRAEALLNSVSELTTAGLPKRVPKAHLVPGSAGPRSDQDANQAGGGTTKQATLAPPPLPPRSADAVRGRMASFQQGLRRGRHVLVEAYSGEASLSSAHRADEEQE